LSNIIVPITKVQKYFALRWSMFPMATFNPIKLKIIINFSSSGPSKYAKAYAFYTKEE